MILITRVMFNNELELQLKFQEEAGKILNKRLREGITCDRRFSAHFGISVSTCAKLWKLLSLSIPADGTPKHLLYMLLFLKTYTPEHVRASQCRCDEKTLRKWVKVFVEAVARLPIVS